MGMDEKIEKYLLNESYNKDVVVTAKDIIELYFRNEAGGGYNRNEIEEKEEWQIIELAEKHHKDFFDVEKDVKKEIKKNKKKVENSIKKQLGWK